MNEQQLAAVKQALEFVKANHSGGPDAFELITALQSIISQDALDKMAEDARTIGLRLDDWDKIGCVNHDCAKCKAQPAPNCTRSHPHENMDAMCELRTEIARLTNENARLKAQPAVQDGRDWSLLEATQESLREHMAEIKRLQKEIIEQCRIIAMGAEREDSLRAEIKRLKAAQPAPVQEPVAEVKAKMTGGNVGIATVIHEIYSPHREPLQPGDKLYAGHRWMGWDIEQVWSERIFGIDMRFENVQDAIKFRAKLDESTPPAPQPVPVKTYSDGKPWPVAPKPWVGLTETEVEAYDSWADFQVGCGRQTLFDMVRDIEAKLKGKNHG
jgi:hypothetical protein